MLSSVSAYFVEAWAFLAGLPVFLQIPLGLCVFFAFPYVARGIVWLAVDWWNSPSVIGGLWEVASNLFRRVVLRDVKATPRE